MRRQLLSVLAALLPPSLEGARLRTSWLAFLALMLTAGFGADARAIPFTITTPAGLNPGDQFFVVFATSTTTPATSPLITTYDAFVTGAASGITYGGVIPTWKVYGRTSTVDNISSFFTGSAPVYLLNDVKIGTSATSFATAGPSPTPFLTIEEDGSTVTPLGTQVWVGQPFGNELGSFAPQFGVPTSAGVDWFSFNTRLSTETTLHLYGFAALTVPQATAVPEPTSLALVLAGIGGLVGALQTRRRREAASPPTKCPTAHS
ncbi:MAG: hypothetical protein V7640_3994 [Betaproteobacteria bacterium]